MWKRFSGGGGTRAARHGLSISDDLRAATLATLSDQVAIIDRDGNVIATNEAWKTFDCQCGDLGLQRVGIGANYLEVCRVAEDAGVGGVEGAILGLRAVLDGSRPHFSLTYVCQTSSGPQWYRMTATPVGSPSDGALVSHTSVAEAPPFGESSAEEIAKQKTGEPLLRALTENLAKTIGARFAFLSELVDQTTGKVRLIALWKGEGFEETFEYEVADTPCQYVLRGELCAYSADVQNSFPDDVWLTEIGAECYLAVPLFSSDGEVMGHLGVIHDERLDDILLAEYVVRAIAAPASVELERLRLLRSLQISDATARALLNAPTDTAMLMEPDGTIVDLNEVAAVRLDITVEEAVGKNVFDLFPPDVAATRRAAMDEVVTTGKPLQTTDERAGMHFESAVYPVLDPDGNVVKVAVFATNVTARKLAEDELRRSEDHHRTLVETITHGIEEIDPSGVITFANKAYHQIYGYEDGELIGKSVLDLSPSEHERAALRDYLALVAETEPAPIPMTAKKKTKSGRIIDVELAWDYRRDADGQVAGLIGVVTDVTARKQAEEALAQSERRMRLVTEHVSEMIWLSDPVAHKLLYVTEAYERMWGRSCQSLYDNPQSWLEAVHPDDLDRVRAASGKPEEAFDEEYRIIHTDGTMRWVWDRSFPIREKPEGRLRKAGITVDITERKLAEEALVDSEQKIWQVTEHITETVWLSDPESQEVLYVSPAYEQIWGRTCQSLYGNWRSWQEAIHPDDLDRVQAASADPEEVFDEEYRILRPDGSVRWIWARSFPVPERRDGRLRRAGVASDITERKLAEDRLQQSEEKFRALVQSSTQGIVSTGSDGRITFASDAALKMFGYDPGELDGQAIEVLVPERHRNEHISNRSGYASQPKARPMGVGRDLVGRRKDGTEFPVEISLTPLAGPDGQRVMVTISDITIRKKAQDDLAMQARVFENMAEGVVVCDDSATILVTNETFEAMFGYESGELIGQHASVLNAGSPEENARVLGDVQTELAQGGAWRGEFNNVRKDGTPFTTSANISALQVSGKTCLISVQEDITERKQAEEAIRQSTQRNASLVEAIPDMMFTLDRQCVYLDFVPAAGLEAYVPPEQFLGKTVFEVLPASLAQDIKQGVELALTTGTQQQLEYKLELDDGDHEYETRILKSKEDEALAIVRDVTAVKRMEREEELRKVRDELEGKVEREMLGKNPYGLTFREFTVLHLAANGEADKEIAERLGISTFTVSKHVANILGKMAASSRTEACVRALREGLLT